MDPHHPDLVAVLPGMTRQDKAILNTFLADIAARRRRRSAAAADQMLPTPELSEGEGEAEDDDDGAAGAPPASDDNLLPTPDSSEEDEGDDQCKDKIPSGASAAAVVDRLRVLNDPAHPDFEPTVIASLDLPDLRRMLPPSVDRLLLQPYIRWAQTVARHRTDVVMISHLLLHLVVTLPSAVLLFRRFSYPHALGHAVWVFLNIGSYATMTHQHMHQAGVLAPPWRVADRLFPLVLGPLMGQTWNSFYYHHKMHHIEENGPYDLSSTLQYQRDDPLHFLQYFARFILLGWLELPLYYTSRRRFGLARAFSFWEMTTFSSWGLTACLDWRATLFVLALPCFILRLGLMLANWCQHACIDREDPTHDLRCSLTLIDVASNRGNYNDGYHAEHHVNPLRHWRDLPVAFLRQKKAYADHSALIICGLDYPAFAYRLFTRNYAYLARCMVPVGRQLDMTLEQRADWIQSLVQPFSREEIAAKFRKGGQVVGLGAGGGAAIGIPDRSLAGSVRRGRKEGGG